MQLNWEREYSTADAFQKGIEICKELNIKTKYTNIGNRIRTEYIELFNQEGRILTSGVGKGGGFTSKVGALFESLEHYLTEYEIDYSKQKFFSIGEIPNIQRCNKEKIIQLLYSNANPKKDILCRKYTCLNKINEELWYPTFITNPFYADKPKYIEEEIEYNTFKRYSSNSGTAIGCSLNEAIIHASNEVIERDALSVFLLKYYYSRSNAALQIIDPDTLPTFLKNFLIVAEKEIGQKIKLINITTELNVPVILAVVQHNTLSIPLFGAGASLYKEYAIKRAISELIQSHHIVHKYPKAHQEVAENLLYFKGFPKHYICAEFNTNTLLNAYEIEVIDFEKISNYFSDNLNEYLQHLVERLHKHNFSIYYSICNQFSNGVHVVNVVIPNTERFFNVLFGQIVFPSGNRELESNTIHKPVLDYDIRVQQESKIFDTFVSNKKLQNTESTNVHVEPYYSRENLFLLKTSDGTFCGRKLAEKIDCKHRTIRMNSIINSDMVLGQFHTYQVNDKEVYLYYTPCTQEKIDTMFLTLQQDEHAEIVFPLSPLDDLFQEYLVSPEDWDSLSSAQLKDLDNDEAHFRNLTVQYLHTQEITNKVFYDPACSTGTFLGHLKQHFPKGIYIGSDQSRKMVDLAKSKLNRVFQAEASDVKINLQVDYLFLRFLNMEVVTIKQAHDLFETLIPLLNQTGQIIIFGHTPVVLNISYIADKYKLQVCRRVGVHNTSTFQYYILRK